MRTTLSDIAREAGVDKSTVSLVLNRNEASRRISEPTRQRVLETAKRLQYRPNVLARAMRGGSTYSIGILWSLAVPIVSAGVARSLAIRARKHGYTPYMLNTGDDRDAFMEALQDFAARRVDGVIIEAHHSFAKQALLEEECGNFQAAVLVTAEPSETKTDQIVHDRYAAIRQVADHFIRTGRKRPAVMLADTDCSSKGQIFATQLAQHGVTLAAGNLIGLPCQATVTGEWCWARTTYETLTARFADGPPFDALMCGADEMAMAAVAWLKSHGLKVPDDVAVVGFNDYEMSRFCDPPLASVCRHDDEVAKWAGEMLFDRLKNADLPQQCREISMEFVRRESAG